MAKKETIEKIQKILKDKKEGGNVLLATSVVLCFKEIYDKLVKIENDLTILKKQSKMMQMKFKVTRTSDGFDNPKPCEDAALLKTENGENIYTIELSSLEELLGFIKKVEYNVVITPYAPNPDNLAGEIEIYDDYRE